MSVPAINGSVGDAGNSIAATSSLQCAHIMGRRSKGTRWHPDNAVALCAGCHIYFTGHPLMFYDWLAAEIGQDKLDWLKMISKRPTKFTDFNLQVLEKDLKFKLSLLN